MDRRAALKRFAGMAVLTVAPTLGATVRAGKWDFVHDPEAPTEPFGSEILQRPYLERTWASGDGRPLARVHLFGDEECEINGHKGPRWGWFVWRLDGFPGPAAMGFEDDLVRAITEADAELIRQGFDLI